MLTYEQITVDERRKSLLGMQTQCHKVLMCGLGDRSCL
jgi:hypothetical protein